MIHFWKIPYKVGFIQIIRGLEKTCCLWDYSCSPKFLKFVEILLLHVVFGFILLHDLVP